MNIHDTSHEAALLLQTASAKWSSSNPEGCTFDEHFYGGFGEAEEMMLELADILREDQIDPVWQYLCNRAIERVKLALIRRRARVYSPVEQLWSDAFKIAFPDRRFTFIALFLMDSDAKNRVVQQMPLDSRDVAVNWHNDLFAQARKSSFSEVVGALDV